MDYVDSYYRSTVSPGAPRPALDADIDTEVCVVGGGLGGLATALGLVERGSSVVVLEARRVGWGASGRNGGIVGSGYSLPAERLVARVGVEQARALYRLTQDAVALVRRRIRDYHMACGPLVDGGLNVSWFDDRKSIRVMRGGRTFSYAVFGRCAFRAGIVPVTRDSGGGFRCARGLP